MALIDNLIGKLAYLLWDIKEGGQRLEELHKLKQQDRLSSDDLTLLQTKKLQKLITHANKTSPWYKKVIANIGVNPQSITLADLQKFPITTKIDIREHADEFISTKYSKQTLNRAKIIIGCFRLK